MEPKQAQAECVCRMCPTYVDCGESLAFCTYPAGHSTCITVERGCICPGCPVYVENDYMSAGFYCTRGPEKA